MAAAALGLGTVGLPGLAEAQSVDADRATGGLDRQTLAAAERLLGLELTDPERDLALEGLAELVEDYRAIRAASLDNSVPPALTFDPHRIAAMGPAPPPLELRTSEPAPEVAAPAARSAEPPLPRIAAPEDLAFLPVSELARLVAAREVSSVELTRLALERLRRFDPELLAVITLTEERALEQARTADREIAAGRLRGPLHGIPWGVKDLMAVPGYRTTWGARPFARQERPELATVVRRLDEAGAVLVAKLSVGALAWGDVWFGGRTNNPWNPEQGSSGSSAGPAAAVAAGLVPFALGTETYGSIVSPSTRCGVTGLRPTFGRVSRYGVMALSWSMDKVGPICRTARDAALVLAVIAGPDGLDPSLVEAGFTAPEPSGRLDGRRVGHVPELFDRELPAEAPEVAREQQRLDRAALDEIRRLGAELVPIELPEGAVGALTLILSAEAAAAMSELTLSGRDDELVRQVADAWPNVFRQARFIPAVEYLQANRIRTGLVGELERRLAEAEVDVYATPTFAGSNLLLTNLTGHPMISVPNGFRADGTPGSFTLAGRLLADAPLVSVAEAYQGATGWFRRRPPLGA